MQQQYSLGVDIGGTFTDIVIYDRNAGRQFSRKILTTHEDPSEAVIRGLRQIVSEQKIPPVAIERVTHATTLFSNAVIERKGAVTGLITTGGFRDSLEFGRELRYELYDLNIEMPPPLVPRNLRVEVPERIKADGKVKTQLDRDALLDRIQELLGAGVSSIAIVFLHSYANPSNEIEATNLIKEQFPELFVTTSHEVVREIREYERASTTLINAYIKPLAHRYLERLNAQIAEQDIKATLLLMVSSGGLTHVGSAREYPVQMLESGPAAAALAAAHFGKDDSDGDLLAFDMGGTTAKLSLVERGEPLVAYGFEAARQRRFIEGSGLPVKISTIELIEIGAGGGSIARCDQLGVLKVGPDSAGSEPGPACYDRGGTKPTVTDADLLLGYLNPDYFAGGTMNVSLDRSREAIAELASQLQLPVPKVAWGIHDLVNESMASAARVHIAERGRDPQHYSLLCTGGAGPVHAYYVAKKIDVKSIICPPSAGVASALGLLVAPVRVDRVATLGMRLDDGDLRTMEQSFEQLESDALQVIRDTGTPLENPVIQRFADGRFVGQGYDLVVPLPNGPY
ncbi:MAG: hydantoinase/oxoprolinase family protein, partial [Vulcanimicrobiaceae bacterium]